MIISASYKTDIPAFYGEWFSNRLRAGFCRMVNPYNRKQHSKISLRSEDVHGFVFWTKNLIPFIGVLDEVGKTRTPFIVQYTINGYPRALESRVVDAERSVQCFRSTAENYGVRALIWRYDTIIHSSLTSAAFHRENFAKLSDKLAGFTDEVVVSFLQLYAKTQLNMNEAARRFGIYWEDPAAESKRELLSDLVAIAREHGMRLTVCTQPHLMVPGAGESRCIDAQRLSDISGRPIPLRVKGMRAGCGCFQSKDIGDYDTCPHGCVYCYAVRRRSLALQRYQTHEPEGEYLFSQDSSQVDSESRKPNRPNTLPLFPDQSTKPQSPGNFPK